MKYITFESLSQIKTVQCLFFPMLNPDANHSAVCIIHVCHVWIMQTEEWLHTCQNCWLGFVDKGQDWLRRAVNNGFVFVAAPFISIYQAVFWPRFVLIELYYLLKKHYWRFLKLYMIHSITNIREWLNLDLFYCFLKTFKGLVLPKI